jgi:dihydroxyacetone kinase DhaKLM complex PTS-EIIA-like component DhaM
LGGTARLTAANGADPNGGGYLRLTEAIDNQTGYAISNNQFATSQGFSINFEFFAYGTTNTAADGFSIYLVDADKTANGNFVGGQTGGNLGYVGVSDGYLGIGVDEYGSYSINEPPRVGGRGYTPQSVALRGAGSYRDRDYSYPYLGGTRTLPYGLSVATPRAQAGSPDYRRIFINAVPVNGAYRITVRLQHGADIETVVSELEVPVPPANLRIGLAGSTGNQNSVHELRKLELGQVPLLRQDSSSTRQGQPVSLNVLSNDIFSYAGYSDGTVDLDIVTPGVQSSVTLPDQGTLSVTALGVVTFTPVASFKGTLTRPYSAKDLVGQSGTPTNLKITIDAAAPTPLPVSLTGFTVAARDRRAIVRWATASEVNNDYFVVKRSFDGKAFTPVAKVKGHGTTQRGNSYEWVDEQVEHLTYNQQPVYYVLQQVDLGGAATYSPVAVARFGSAAAATVAPNPTSGPATLDLSGLPAGTYQVQLLSVMGQCLRTYSLAGQAQHELAIEQMPAGAYLVRITGDGTSQTLRLHRY